MDSKMALRCWDIFVKYYFGIKDSYGKEEFEQEIKKYALLGFLSHAVLLPLRECQVWAKNALFNDAFM